MMMDYLTKKIFSLVPIVQAQGVDLRDADPLKGAKLIDILNRVLSWGMTLATFVVPILVIIGAFQMITAAGDPEKFKKGQKTILYTVIGFIIVSMAKGIAMIARSVLVTS